MKKSYPDIVINAFQSVQAWKSLAILMMGAVTVLLFGVIYLASNRTVILVPQHLASTAKGPIALNLGEPFSPDYLTSVAKGDLYPLLNWTPENIDTQYELFIERLSPAVRDAQREVLLNELKQHRDEGLTQSFYVTRTYVNGSEVTAYGILVRSTGGKEIFRGPAVFAVDYRNSGNAMLNVNGVRQPTDAEQRNTPAPSKQ